MTRRESLRLAFSGLLAMAAALGIGRFVYTPILPFMLDALSWSKADAGLVASANFLGYLAGALIAGHSIFSTAPRRWLLIALAVSAATTAGTGMLSDTTAILCVRCIGGMASAFVIVCASTLVLDRLSAAGQGNLAAIHFAGVGTGIFISAAVVASSIAYGAGWPSLWTVSGSVAALMAVLAAVLLQPTAHEPIRRSAADASEGKPTPIMMICNYGDVSRDDRAPITRDSLARALDLDAGLVSPLCRRSRSGSTLPAWSRRSESLRASSG